MKFRAYLSHAKTALYRKPKSEVQRLVRWGPEGYFLCETWKKGMERAAWDLPLPAATQISPVSLWFLTGRNFWYQTAFCAWTFSRQAERGVILNLVDDGTLSQAHEQALRRLFPQGITIRKEEIAEKIDRHLPSARFPILRQRWLDYVNIRKLTDIHLGSSGPKLVLDSDMLFFQPPTQLLQWIDQPAGCVLMTDSTESYGYSRALMERLCGANIPPKLNVGVCGLRSETLNWEELEHWCRTLLENEGTNYYLEQALVAMLAARSETAVMPAGDYITFPTRDQTVNRRGVLQHYVADSKPWYFKDGWKLAMA